MKITYYPSTYWGFWPSWLLAYYKYEGFWLEPTNDMSKLVIRGHNHKYTVIHLNIHSLPSKYDHLITNLEDISLVINLFMLCETILSYINVSYPG